MLPTAVLTDLWPLMMDIRQQFFPARRSYFKAPPPIDLIQQEFDIRGETLGHFLYCMSNYNPGQFSVAHYRRRNCYDSLPTVEGWITQWVAEGVLETADPPIYSISEKGHRLFDRANELIRPRWGLPTLPDTDFDRLNDLLRRVATSIVYSPEPPPHWATTTRAKSGLKIVTDFRLEQYNELVFDLWAYRDDMHLAAWQPHQIEPHTWEAFTYLWRGEGQSAETLAEALKPRGFSAEVYAASITELVQRKWINPPTEEDIVWLTRIGKLIRDGAEELTDEYFYHPWSCLSHREIEMLRGLLIRLHDGLKTLAQLS